MSKRFNEIKKDYLELTGLHGEPYDMTGGFVDAEQMRPVIMSPTKKNAGEYLESVIKYGFQFKERDYHNAYGKYISIDDCEVVKRIYEKYIKI